MQEIVRQERYKIFDPYIIPPYGGYIKIDEQLKLITWNCTISSFNLTDT